MPQERANAAQPAQRRRLYDEAAAAYGDALGRLAAAYEANAAERADLEQAIHLQLWRSLEQFDGRCSLRTWVYRVAHNVAASHARAATRRHSLLDGGDPHEMEIAANCAAPDEEVARTDALAKIYRTIRGMGSTDRQVMLLYLEDVDSTEIAGITGLTPGAVATRISRIKAALRQRFGGAGS